MLIAAALIATPAVAQHDGHATPAPARAADAVGTDQEPGSAPAPAVPADRYADRFWSPEAMARARNRMHADHGGMAMSMIMFNLAEVQVRDGRDAYRVDGEGWFGGDIDRLAVKLDGEGRFAGAVDMIEVQALYSRAIDAYWNLQAGVRHDVRQGADRSYATIAVDGLAPYWFDLEAALFLSDRGDLLGRIEGSYDQRITNRLVIQPRAELNFAAQSVPASAIGSGVSEAELGLRLRYEIVREFAPYIGVSWERKLGDTARFARAAGEAPTSSGLVVGMRVWF